MSTIASGAPTEVRRVGHQQPVLTGQRARIATVGVRWLMANSRIRASPGEATYDEWHEHHFGPLASEARKGRVRLSCGLRQVRLRYPPSTPRRGSFESKCRTLIGRRPKDRNARHAWDKFLAELMYLGARSPVDYSVP